jgi:hypothetical protein
VCRVAGGSTETEGSGVAVGENGLLLGVHWHWRARDE